MIARLYYYLRLHAKHHEARERERGKGRSRRRRRLGIVAVGGRLDSRRRKRLSEGVGGLVRRPRKQRAQRQHCKYVVSFELSLKTMCYNIDLFLKNTKKS
jgi:hypothetical protein